VVLDGGMATALYEKGFYINRNFEELTLVEPQAVREVMRAYLRAGSEALSTNTYGALYPKLAEHGIQGQLEEILVQAVSIAREVALDQAYVLGVIGPLGLVLEPLGRTSVEEARSFFRLNARVFEREGVDAISLKGFHDLTELSACLEACREYTQRPIFAQVAVQENMRTSFGHTLDEFVEACERFEVDVVGISGEVGPSGALTDKPLSVLPNAGLPRFVNDEYIYLCSPDYIGKYAKRFAQAGARLIGGHSGVHEPHIRAISNALRASQGARVDVFARLDVVLKPAQDSPRPASPIEARSRLGARLKSGQKILTVEIMPPKGVVDPHFDQHCRKLDAAGVEFVNIPDGARAMARMGSLPLAAYVKSRFKVEPIPHFTPRDRNLLGLQADLLGCHVNGVRNLLLVTGDPPKLGNLPGASAVYDVDSIGLTHIVQRMNQGLDLGGSSFGSPSEFVFGVALNPTARQSDLELKRLRFKVEAGAMFAITQPIYNLDAYRRFMDQLGGLSLPVIMGIWPLVSLRNAEFLKNEVPGVDVPDEVIGRLEKAGSGTDDAMKVGLEIAIEIMLAAAGEVAGFQVSAPFNRVGVALDAMKGSGLL
jgi:homocysteine S-methyltransferase